MFHKLIKSIFLLIVTFAFLLCFYILTPFSAFSFHSDYIDDAQKWNGTGSIIHYEDSDFSGFMKYEKDPENACFYTYLYFYDSRIAYENDNNITLSFVVSNDEITYRFCVNKNGITAESDEISRDRVHVYCNFDNVSCSKSGGEILAGFELTDKNDTSLKNKISCEFSCGLSSTKVLFTDIPFDLTKNNTTQSKTSKPTSSLSNKSTADRTVKTTQKSSDTQNGVYSDNHDAGTTATKFTPSSYTTVSQKNQNSSQSEQTQTKKFDVNNYAERTVNRNNNMDTYSAATTSARENSGEPSVSVSDTVSDNAENNSVSSVLSMSDSAKICAAAATCAAVLGISLVLTGCFNKRKHSISSDNEENKSDKN